MERVPSPATERSTEVLICLAKSPEKSANISIFETSTPRDSAQAFITNGSFTELNGGEGEVILDELGPQVGVENISPTRETPHGTQNRHPNSTTTNREKETKDSPSHASNTIHTQFLEGLQFLHKGRDLHARTHITDSTWAPRHERNKRERERKKVRSCPWGDKQTCLLEHTGVKAPGTPNCEGYQDISTSFLNDAPRVTAKHCKKKREEKPSCNHTLTTKTQPSQESRNPCTRLVILSGLSQKHTKAYTHKHGGSK